VTEDERRVLELELDEKHKPLTAYERSKGIVQRAEEFSEAASVNGVSTGSVETREGRPSTYTVPKAEVAKASWCRCRYYPACRAACCRCERVPRPDGHATSPHAEVTIAPGGCGCGAGWAQREVLPTGNTLRRVRKEPVPPSCELSAKRDWDATLTFVAGYP